MVDDQSIAFIDSNQNVSTHKNVENEENFNTDVFLNSESSERNSGKFDHAESIDYGQNDYN